MMKKKILTILTAGALSLSVTGCAISENTYDPTAETEAPVAEATATDAPEVTLAPTAEEAYVAPDYGYAFEKYDADMVVGTVHGIDVKWEEYFYWGLNSKLYAEQIMGPITDYTTEIAPEMTMADFILDGAVGNTTQYRAIEKNAADLGVELSEESKTAIADQLAFDISNYSADGTEEGFNAYLEENYTSREMYDYFSEVSALLTDTFVSQYGENGSLVTDEEALAFAEENGIMVAKHILFSTVDEMNQPIPEADKEAVRATAQGVLDELMLNSGDINTVFDEKMAEYSEDPGAAYYPDGYCFGPGQMVAEFEAATAALSAGQFTAELVESSFGYHIILRGEVTPESQYMGDQVPVSVREMTATTRFNETIATWFEDATIEYVDGFTPDFAAIFAE